MQDSNDQLPAQDAVNQSLPPEYQEAIAKNIQASQKAVPQTDDIAPDESAPLTPTISSVSAPEPMPAPTPVPAPSPEPAVSQPQVSPSGGENDAQDVSQLITEIEGTLIPETLTLMLADDFADNKPRVYENLSKALSELGEVEMMSDPGDLLRRESLGELVGKLKMLEIVAGRLASR